MIDIDGKFVSLLSRNVLFIGMLRSWIADIEDISIYLGYMMLWRLNFALGYLYMI